MTSCRGCQRRQEASFGWPSGLGCIHMSLTADRGGGNGAKAVLDGLFNSAVALAGRNSAADDLRQRIATDRGPIVVEAPTVEEALEFIAAVGEVSDCPADGGSLLDCMVFVNGPNAWRRLSGRRTRPDYPGCHRPRARRSSGVG